jgi:hypothetical protein
MGRAAHWVTLVAVLGALGACSSDKKAEPDPNIFPAGYRQEILLTLTNTLDDPTGIRDAFISEPVLRAAGREPRYVVCMRFNSRDINKQYSGVKERIAFFYGGYLNQMVDATKEQCGAAAYKPWPELEKYCMATNCK